MPDAPEMIAAIRAGCANNYQAPCDYPHCQAAIRCSYIRDTVRAAIAAHEAARPPAEIHVEVSGNGGWGRSPEDGNAG